MNYAIKWLLYGVIIGVVAGLSALLFHFTVSLIADVFASITGFSPTSPNVHGVRYWLTPIAVAAGAFASGLLVYTFVGSSEELGINAMIEAYHKRRGEVGVKVPILGWLASALTIGFGGSVGSEAPMATLSGGLTSLLMSKLGADDADRRTAFAAALGVGIGAILKAPVGGAILSAEILYRRDVEWAVLYPSLVASSIAYVIYSSVTGFGPLLGNYNAAVSVYEQPLFIAVGAVDGLMARLYVYSLHKSHEWFKALRINNYAKPLVGGLVVGSMGLIAPEVLGEGLSWAKVALSGRLDGFVVLGLPAAGAVLAVLLVLLPFLKVVATALTVNSGAAGGIFVPGLAVGAFLGLDMGLLFRLAFPGVVGDVVPFVVASMLAMFGVASRAPLAVTAMVLEMTNDYRAVIGALLALAVAYVVIGDETVFPAQPASKLAETPKALPTELF